ncbi:MAG: copper amine oxidase N-terminal domain-containing protein, partial [Firmicutes bacterium]|nr:copper amine oxidase N-terminal domain-containing protein [Bacillota bacterium]
TKDFTDGSETRTEIDTPPQIIDGRTLVPIRAVSEALSVGISWNDDERTVVIKSEDLAD